MGGYDGGDNPNPYEIREHDIINGQRGLSYGGDANNGLKGAYINSSVIISSIEKSLIYPSVNLFNKKHNNVPGLGGNISVGSSGYELKLGIARVNFKTATLTTDLINPLNSNPTLSQGLSLAVFGFGFSLSRKSYDLGDTWTNLSLDFITDWTINENTGGVDYNTGIGFRSPGMNWQYDFAIPDVISGAH
jgi:hypothetical protein